MLDRIAQVLGSTLGQVIRNSKQMLDGTAAGDKVHLGLADIGRAIAELPTGGYKVERATSAAVLHAFAMSGGNQSVAARTLGMERKAYVRRLARARKPARVRVGAERGREDLDPGA